MGFRGKKAQTWQNLPDLPHTDARAPPINTVRHRYQHDVAPPQFRSSIFRCPPTSIFRVLINRPTSCSAFLFTLPYHLSLASYISHLCLPHLFWPYFVIPELLNSHHPSKLFSASFAQPFSVPRSHFHILGQVSIYSWQIGPTMHLQDSHAYDLSRYPPLMMVLLYCWFFQCRHI